MIQSHYLLSGYLVFFVFLLAGGLVSASSDDAPSILWFKTYGQEGQDDALDLLISQGGFIVGGMTESPELDVDDSWIKMINPDGVTSYTRHYDMEILDEARAIISLPKGDLVMGGANEPFGENFPTDAAVIQVDEDGDILWNMTFGDPLIQESVLDIASRSGGGYIFSGFAEDWRDGSMKALLVSLNQTGSVEWFRTYPRGTGSDAQSVLVLDNGYLIAGYADISGNSDYQGWLAKTDTNGEIIWEKTFGGDGVDAFHRIIPLETGYLLVGEKELGLYGTSDVWVVLVDSYGNTILDRNYGGDGNDKAFDATIPASGGYLISGWTESYGAGMRDAWIIRLDSDGEPIWSKTIGGPSNDMASSAEYLPDGGIIVAGLTDSYGAGQYDAMVVKMTGGKI